MYVKVYLML